MAQLITQEQFDGIARAIDSGQLEGERASMAVKMMERFQSPEQTQLRAEANFTQEQDKAIEEIGTTKRAVIGAGAEFTQLWDGTLELLGMTDDQQDEKVQRSQELFARLDDQGFGAEDIGSAGVMMLTSLIPGANTVKGAALGSFIMGGLRSESDNSASGRLGRAMFEGAAGLGGATVTQYIGMPVARAVGGAVETLGNLPGMMGTIAKGMFGKAGTAGIKEQQAMALREAIRPEMSALQKKLMNEGAERLQREANVPRDEILEQIGRMDAMKTPEGELGKLAVGGGILANVRKQIGEVGSIADVQKIWTTHFGGWKRSQLKKLYGTTQGDQLWKLGQRVDKMKGTDKSVIFADVQAGLNKFNQSHAARFAELDAMVAAKAARGQAGFIGGTATSQVGRLAGDENKAAFGADVIDGLQANIDGFFSMVPEEGDEGFEQ